MRLLVDLSVVFFALVASTAVIVGTAHHFAVGYVARLGAHVRARIRLTALVAPLVVGLLGVSAALLPSVLHMLGLAGDHCLNPVEHNHAHLCLVHRPSGGSPVLAAIVAVFASVVTARAALMLRGWWKARNVFASVLATTSVRRVADNEFIFDSELPVCVTTGLLQPKIYVSSAAVDALGEECTEAALAHERGHIARHETRLRFVAALLETLHVPGFGRSLAHHWHEDSEFLCDQHAARQTGSTVVAEALVRFRKAVVKAHAAPALGMAGLCASESSLYSRVNVLLETDDSAVDPSVGNVTYLVGTVLLIGGLAIQARHLLHHSLESFVGALTAAVLN